MVKILPNFEAFLENINFNISTIGQWITSTLIMNCPFGWCWLEHLTQDFLVVPVQVNGYEIVENFFHISHILTWYSAIVHKFTSLFNLWTDKTIHVNLYKKNGATDLKKNYLYHGAPHFIDNEEYLNCI